ncbi:hypothetical protein KKH39_00040 [Patescibacteria group bacterium]|nr:hypothetical protein [Patescibacteria group bacterium]
MKKQNLIIYIIILLLIVAGVFYYFDSQKNIVVNNNQNTNIDNVNTSELDTSDWVEYDNMPAGYSFRYLDGMKLIINEDMLNVNLLTLRTNDSDDNVVSFRAHTKESHVQRGLGFQDFHTFESVDGSYYVTYGTDQRIEVQVIEVLNNDIGSVAIIDGKALNETMPILGVSSDYVAIINLLEGYHYYGISVVPNDDIVSYDEFIRMMRSIKAI